jgi:hypothetical protein
MLFQMLLVEAAPVDEIRHSSSSDKLHPAPGGLDVARLAKILMRIAARKTSWAALATMK